MLIIHHLGRSQSERIPWICEELGLPYELKRYDRTPMGAGPPEYKALDFYGTAPVINDGDVTLGESGAIVEYISRTYAGGKLLVGPGAANFTDFLYWFHFGNGTFVPAVMMALSATMSGSPGNSEVDRIRLGRFNRAYDMAEQRLGQVPYFAGAEFTAADIMMLFPMTTMRLFQKRDLSGSPNLLAYLKRIGERPAYQRAMQKAEPGFAPMLT